MIPKELSLLSIKKTYKKLSSYVLETPITICTPLINEILKTKAIFKMELLQNAGTFKCRGAINNILNLNHSQKKKWCYCC